MVVPRRTVLRAGEQVTAFIARIGLGILMVDAGLLNRNLVEVRRRIATAASRSDRDPEDVRIVAVTKLVDEAWIPLALEAGLDMLGENRSNDLVRKAKAHPLAEWHFIGRLHTRDPKRLTGHAAAIHSVASLTELGLCTGSAGAGTFPPVLLQCNTSGEVAKQGFDPSGLLEAVPALRSAAGSGLEIVGLMTMAPWGAPETTIRGCFRRLSELRDALREEAGLAFPELSMGMSDDFEIAIEEGATLVRLGRALFGDRSHP